MPPDATVRHKTVGIKCDNEEWLDSELHIVEGFTLAGLEDTELGIVGDGNLVYFDAATGLWKVRSGAPLAHKTSHQDGEADEINVGGLSGELADNQPAKAHPLGGIIHNIDSLVHLNARIGDATLDDSGDPRDPNAHHADHEDGGDDAISSPIALAGVPTLTTPYTKDITFFSTASTTEVVVTGSNQNIIVASGEWVLCIVSGFLLNNTQDESNYIGVFRDNTQLAFAFLTPSLTPIAAGYTVMFAVNAADAPAANTYTYQLKAKVTGGTGYFYPIKAIYILMRR